MSSRAAGAFKIALALAVAGFASVHALEVKVPPAPPAVASSGYWIAPGQGGVLPPRVVGVALIAIPLAISGRWRMTRDAFAYVVACGVFEVVGFALYAWGARHGLAISAVLASQFAAISAVIGYLAFRERLARIQVVGVATIVIGVSVLGALHG